jgi:ABC-2 type transport system permease protein
MLAFFYNMFKDKLRSLIIFTVSSVAFLEMYVASFPLLASQADQFNEMMKMMPKELFQAFNIEAETLSFSRLESYIAMENYGIFWPILTIIFTIGLANYLCASDIEKGTIEAVAALPVSRFKMFFGRYFSGLTMLAIFVLVSVFATFPLAELHNISYASTNYVTLAVGGLLFFWAVYAMSVFFSTVFSEKGHVSMIAGGTIMLMYVLNVLSTFKDSLKNLQYFSFFHYYDANTLLDKNQYVEYSFIVFIGLALLFTLLAALRFNRRDLSV